MTGIEAGSNNVYADLGTIDASEMLVKARLAAKISQTIKAKGWTQQHAAKVLGISQSKLSELIRGKFRGISDAKMMECLSLLGHRVQIVITEQPALVVPSPVEVVFA